MYGDREMLVELKNAQKLNYDEIPSIKSLKGTSRGLHTAPSYNYMSRTDRQASKLTVSDFILK